MKKMYLDVTEIDGCIGIFAKDVEIQNAGTTVYSMSVRHKNEEYQRYEKIYEKRKLILLRNNTERGDLK